METARQGPQEVVPDAYAEHIRAKRAEEQIEKIGTLRLPVTQLKAIGLVIGDTLESLIEPLPAEQQRVWLSIVRSIASAVREAE